jgi:putative transcriptional regulator
MPSHLRRAIILEAVLQSVQPVPAKAGIKAIRAKTKLSQAKFAQRLRVPVGTVRDWEQLRRTPDAPARTLLGMVNADPKAALALIEKGMG